MAHSGFVRSQQTAEESITGRLTGVVFILLMIAAATPVLLVQVPPLGDYINHLSRMHALADLDKDPLLARFYQVKWQLVPNLMMDLVVPPLVHIFDVYLAGQMFVLLTMAIMVTGVFAVNFAIHRQFSPWPLVSFVFIYNNILLFGFVNYLFGIGLASWALAIWILIRDRGPEWRLVVSALMITAMFVCHLFAVGLYGLCLVCFETWREFQRTGARRYSLTRDIIAFAAPFLVLVPLMLLSPTIGLATDISWDFSEKLDGIYYLVQNYSDFFDLLLTAIMVALLIWAVRQRLLSFHPVGWILLLASAVLYMAMPRVLFGSWGADLRLPVASAFLLMGFVRINLPTRAVAYGFFAVIVGLSVTRDAAVQLTWMNLDKGLREFRDSVSMIEPGSTVLVAEADRPDGNDQINNAISHAASFAMLERSSFVSTTFVVPGKQVLEVKPAFESMANIKDDPPPAVGDLLAAVNNPQPDSTDYWERWPERFDYLYVLYNGGDFNPAPDDLRLIFAGENFQLFEVQAPD